MQMGSKESWSSNPHFKQNRPKIKKITRDKEGYYIMIKGSTQEEDNCKYLCTQHSEK